MPTRHKPKEMPLAERQGPRFQRTFLGSFSFLIIDAIYCKSCTDYDGVVCKAALMIFAVNAEGNREIPDVRIGKSEISHIAFVTSDDHLGMVKALK
ncbi:MAG: hypothetical protein OXC62_01465 [Aestuariivita sp.]|nr:hypothetical protein [Aestuariivita sp.]